MLRVVSAGEAEVVSRTLDDRAWIVAYEVDDGPVRYFLYDRVAREASFLFTNRAALEGQPLVRMHSAIVKSRDGLDLVCYYSLPPGSDPDGDGHPDRPQPMVLFPHGGPWGRDVWGFDPYQQWLANRGYATLSVNFRASTGFGKAFVNAGDREWGGKVMEDQQDAVRWAIAQGIADAARVGVMGGSFGGYSVLAGLTLFPEAFVCGVDLVGPSNLFTLLESVPPYWKPQFELFAAGGPMHEEGRFWRSTRHHLRGVSAARCSSAGANDPRQAGRIGPDVGDAGQDPVTYVLYWTGHGFARPENNLSFNAIAEAFLARCLGGRVEPVGDDFEGASLTVPTGAEVVPGLAEALSARQ
jgi:dipeptidyl aminopeptidase/acylaminoacyl peptidase